MGRTNNILAIKQYKFHSTLETICKSLFAFPKEDDYVFEPDKKLMAENGIYISQGIEDGKSDNLIMQVFNHTAEVKEIRNNTHLGMVGVIPLIAAIDQPKKNEDSLSKFCYTKNLEPIQIQKLLKTLYQHKDVFETVKLYSPGKA